MHTNVWTTLLSEQVARIASPMPAFFWSDVYQAFDEFVAWAKANPERASALDALAKAWRAESGLRTHFSGYFSPYFRDRAGRPGRDNKQIIQMCEPFYRYLWRKDASWFSQSTFRVLVDRMMAALYTCHATCTPTVNALSQVDPALARRLMPCHELPPVAIRLLRYEVDQYYCTNPHVDKSAITVIVDSDDPVDAPSLVFAPRGSSTVKLSEFTPAHRQHGESLVFLGAAPAVAGFPQFSAACHAVRRSQQGRVRHVAIFFWLLPEANLADFDTRVPFIDDLGEARPQAVAEAVPV